jgi:proteic killer suppression protein
VIAGFSNKGTEDIFNDRNSREAGRILPADLHRLARKKLVMIDAAGSVDDLKIPPGNKLEKLSGDLAGMHSIRINERWRIIFLWNEQGPINVEISDYH